jgi:hypothetical protein
MPETKQELKIGDLHDGGVYVGKSATTGDDLHVAFWDEPEYVTYEEPLAAAEQLNFCIRRPTCQRRRNWARICLPTGTRDA